VVEKLLAWLGIGLATIDLGSQSGRDGPYPDPTILLTRSK